MDVKVGHFCDYLGRIEHRVKSIKGGMWVFGLYEGGIVSCEAYSLGGHFRKMPTEEQARQAYEALAEGVSLRGGVRIAVFDEFGSVEWDREFLESGATIS